MKVSAGEAPRRYLFTCNDEVQVKSMVELIVLPDVLGKRPAGYIHKVYTDEQFRNHGYASLLMKEAIEQAKEDGCHKVFLICDESMVPFYERFGLSKHQVGMEVRF